MIIGIIGAAFLLVLLAFASLTAPPSRTRPGGHEARRDGAKRDGATVGLWTSWPRLDRARIVPGEATDGAWDMGAQARVSGVHRRRLPKRRGEANTLVSERRLGWSNYAVVQTKATTPHARTNARAGAGAAYHERRCKQVCKPECTDVIAGRF